MVLRDHSSHPVAKITRFATMCALLAVNACGGSAFSSNDAGIAGHTGDAPPAGPPAARRTAAVRVVRVALPAPAESHPEVRAAPAESWRRAARVARAAR